ncbi:endo-1,4-beta-xylanase [Qipengyuania xiapuensis]|uniref:Beta-xylanase n=1 Tax=Qipengyuania xiapuensis TaxID=2867236 RepID=A0ABX8ZV30_9SPHN|nr:endo-1,4-beta-xylanase [Qipengyuania xiapuensis]QZD92886.1 endo-1,4-beta-xylanase [Qipengyuania xiapuensis]
MNRRSFLNAAGTATLACASGMATPSLARGSSTLDALARRKGLTFGIATSHLELANPQLARLLAASASVTLARNEMKWKRIEKVEGQRDYSRARVVADFAANNGLSLRGHNVVWNMDVFLPPWLVEIGQGPPAAARKAVARHMWHHGHRLAKAFPEVGSWDVVNEAINPFSGKLRNSVLTRLFGEGVFDLSFRIMRQKSPGTQLVYNDVVDWRENSMHRTALLRTLEGALKRSVPIDAIGIQSHLGPNLGKPIDVAAWSSFLDDLSDFGLPVLLTELDCDDRNLGRIDPTKRDRILADEVRRYLDVTLDSRNVREVISWMSLDFDMRRFWHGKQRPKWIPEEQNFVGGVFDGNLQRTPVHHAIEAAFRSAPER